MLPLRRPPTSGAGPSHGGACPCPRRRCLRLVARPPTAPAPAPGAARACPRRRCPRLATRAPATLSRRRLPGCPCSPPVLAPTPSSAPQWKEVRAHGVRRRSANEGRGTGAVVLARWCRRADGKLERSERPVARAAAAARGESTRRPPSRSTPRRSTARRRPAPVLSRDFIWAVRLQRQVTPSVR
jgi:hypothetical protein